jgi:hypothetical protein
LVPLACVMAVSLCRACVPSSGFPQRVAASMYSISAPHVAVPNSPGLAPMGCAASNASSYFPRAL